MNSAGKVVMECVLGTKASVILQFVDGLRGADPHADGSSQFLQNIPVGSTRTLQHVKRVIGLQASSAEAIMVPVRNSGLWKCTNYWEESEFASETVEIRRDG
jgi:hypothetical protein